VIASSFVEMSSLAMRRPTNAVAGLVDDAASVECPRG